jgi:hypothetical protein
VNGEQAYRFGLANAARDTDGNVVEKSLVEIVAHAIDFDPEKERLGLAQRIVSSRKRPGQTAPAGKVCLPGLESHEYEPDRLIADGAGNVIENWRATAKHKKAEAARSLMAYERASERAEQDRVEADLITEWTNTEQANGRDPHELIWGTCVRETGLLDGAGGAA